MTGQCRRHVRLRCPLLITSIARDIQGLAALDAEQSRAERLLILENATPASCSGCCQGVKSCWAAPFCLCRPKRCLGAGARHSAGVLPRQLPRVSEAPRHWLTRNSGCQDRVCHLQVSPGARRKPTSPSRGSATPRHGEGAAVRGSPPRPQDVLGAWAGVGKREPGIEVMTDYAPPIPHHCQSSWVAAVGRRAAGGWVRRRQGTGRQEVAGPPLF